MTAVRMRRWAAGAVAALAALVPVALVVGLAPPASAGARVTVANDQGGGAQADLTYETALTVGGTGFQSVKGGFGGVYVAFGWVRDPDGGSWRPSKGGTTGSDYRYVPDTEGAGNRGYLAFVAFPGSSTTGEAQSVMSDDGAFTANLTVPGPVFQSVDRNGATVSVDCREVTCGVITIGAHGVTNATNETFTPVTFGTVYEEKPTPTAEATTPSPVPTTAATETPGVTTTTGTDPVTTTAVPGTSPVLTTDRTTAIPGHALAFTARGFSPGEQVLAVLDDGVAALGPMVAGTSGEVAGLLQLPTDLTTGTHELRLTGAASGAQVSEMFPVIPASDAAAPGDDTTASSSAADPDEPEGLDPSRVFLAAAVVAFLVAVGVFVARRRRRAAHA